MNDVGLAIVEAIAPYEESNMKHVNAAIGIALIETACSFAKYCDISKERVAAMVYDIWDEVT